MLTKQPCRHEVAEAVLEDKLITVQPSQRRETLEKNAFYFCTFGRSVEEGSQKVGSGFYLAIRSNGAWQEQMVALGYMMKNKIVYIHFFFS